MVRKSEANMKIRQIYNELHPGITMHKIPVKAGFAGLIFTVGTLTVFLIGIPALIYFIVPACVVGIGFAVMLRFIPRQAEVVLLVLSAVMIVCLIGIPGIDWPEKLPERMLLADVMAPPPPDFLYDSSIPLQEPCDSTTQPNRDGQERPDLQSPFDGTWECTMNGLQGVDLLVADATGGRIGGVVTFYLQTLGYDGKWHVASKFVAPLLVAHAEGKILVFEVQHHTYGNSEFGPNVKFRMELTGEDEALLYNLSQPSIGPSKLVRQE